MIKLIYSKSLTNNKIRSLTWLLIFRIYYIPYNEGGFLKMEINKKNLVSSLLEVGTILLYTTTAGFIVYDVIKTKTDKNIEKLNQRIDSLEKSIKKNKR